MSTINEVKDYLLSLQNRIVSELEELDGKERFHRDAWDRPGGGGGESRVLKRGGIFEQAGVNFSHVFGKELPPSATKCFTQPRTAAGLARPPSTSCKPRRNATPSSVTSSVSSE